MAIEDTGTVAGDGGPAASTETGRESRDRP
jgi:hypothetical protein